MEGGDEGGVDREKDLGVLAVADRKRPGVRAVLYDDDLKQRVFKGSLEKLSAGAESRLSLSPSLSTFAAAFFRFSPQRSRHAKPQSTITKQWT